MSYVDLQKYAEHGHLRVTGPKSEEPDDEPTLIIPSDRVREHQRRLRANREGEAAE